MKPTPLPPYQPPPTMTRAQTLLWFVGGITCMFVVVSIAFAIKLAGEGRLPFFKSGKAGKLVSEASAGSPPAKSATDGETVSPPISAATVTGSASRSFVSGSDNLLPTEAGNTARIADPEGNIPAAPALPAPPVSAPPVSAAPAPAPGAATPAAPSPASSGESVELTLQKWASAWSRKDVDGYLQHYAADFRPGNGISHEVWISQRRQRLGRPEEISVSLEGLSVTTDGGKASARFTQIYRAGPQTLREAKTLELVLQGGQWRISQERLGG